MRIELSPFGEKTLGCRSLEAERGRERGVDFVLGAVEAFKSSFGILEPVSLFLLLGDFEEHLVR